MAQRSSWLGPRESRKCRVEIGLENVRLIKSIFLLLILYLERFADGKQQAQPVGGHVINRRGNLSF